MSYMSYRRVRRAVLSLSVATALGTAALFAQDSQDLPKPPAATQTPTPTQKPAETPKTAPQVKKVLPSYEGQTVSAIEIAGRPDVKTEDYQQFFLQKVDEPFSQEKVQQTIDALKRDTRFHDVQLQVRPEQKGVRILL